MYTETEIKLHVKDLETLARRLQTLGATLVSPRTHEVNLRFDTPAGTLSAQARVLRLRQDAHSKLTYKGPTENKDGVAHREEIEFIVSDFNAAKRFLEALGYQLATTYEKYRTTYQLDDFHVMLDEMPYGDFVEIEGNEVSAIRTLAEKLSLNVDAAVKMSYLQILDRLRSTEKLSVENLTFNDFEAESCDLAQVSIYPADSFFDDKKTYNTG